MEYKLKIYCNKKQMLKICEYTNGETSTIEEYATDESEIIHTRKMSEEQMDNFIEYLFNKKTPDIKRRELENEKLDRWINLCNAAMGVLIVIVLLLIFSYK